MKGNGEKEMILPEKIRSMVTDEPYERDEIGMSGASIFLFGDQVLKVQEDAEEAENEVRMMRFLQGKLPVPRIRACEGYEGKSYLLMSKCEGQMACAREYMSHPTVLRKLLAEGLKRLWSVDISDCPSDQTLMRKLEMARYNIEHGLVDMENVEPDTFGEDGFRDPEELLAWLYENRPEEELALSHGDYCLPNIFGHKDEVTGFIDLGKTGIADKWCDIAICYRSLSHNYSGRYGKRFDAVCSEYDDRQLFRELGVEPDWEKIRYYILLDELF